jgi:hypothetical protein
MKNALDGMVRSGHASTLHSEVVTLIRFLELEYPIASKGDFLALMNRTRRPVPFRGRTYEVGFGANLIPDFFFPVTSEAELILKITELLMSRGLLALDDRAAPATADVAIGRMEPLASVTHPVDREISDVVQEVESHIRRPAAAGALDRETVEALDVVTHALVFVRHPFGLELWREALWGRQLPDEARDAVVRMLEYLNDAVAQGRTQEVSRICDCLHLVVRAAPAHRQPDKREIHDAR